MKQQLDRDRIRFFEKKIVDSRHEKDESLPLTFRNFGPDYVGFHSRRFASLLVTLEDLGVTSDSGLLDVGPTFTAKCFADHFKCRVDTMSFSEEADTPFGHNYFFDLNRSQNEQSWRTDLGPYDVITFAEVIEHLHTAPTLAMKYLGSLLAPGGHLIVQTPNALGLKQRIQLLLGRHPYEQISLDPNSPNHYRESTLAELVRYANDAGLEVVHARHYNYFNPTYRQQKGRIKPWMGAIFFRLSDFLPQKLKRGMMIVCRKPAN